MKQNFILNLSDVGIDDVDLVGGKNASLGEMLQNLSHLGISIPDGFVITVEAYREFIEYNDLEYSITSIISAIEHDNIESLRRGGQQVRLLIENGRFPKSMSEKIIEAYSRLSASFHQEYTDVAVRSSATAEDLPD